MDGVRKFCSDGGGRVCESYMDGRRVRELYTDVDWIRDVYMFRSVSFTRTEV